MKKRNARSLSVVLLAVIILGLVIINASASCACGTTANWVWNYRVQYDFIYLNDNEHGIMKSDIAYCNSCGEFTIYCTHTEGIESHDFNLRYIRYDEDLQLHEYEEYCTKCGFVIDIVYLPY